MTQRNLNLSIRAAFACALLAIALPLTAQAQATAAPAPSSAAPGPGAVPAATPAPVPGAAPAPPRKAAKRRAPRKDAAMGCERVNDPWGDLCQIRKNAEVACRDLAVPAKARAVRKSRKDAPPPQQARNLRQECIDSYMRNV